MPENLTTDSPKPPDPDEQENLRALNRTPHPYHHQSEHLPYAADRFDVRKEPGQLRSRSTGNGTTKWPSSIADAYKESSHGSDSGTEADDEHFLKGLPAPKTKLHKGLRGQNEHLSGTPSPMPSPTWAEEEAKDYTQKPIARQQPLGIRILGVVRHNKNLTQRATEAGIVTCLSLMVLANEQVQPVAKAWDRGKHPRSSNPRPMCILLIIKISDSLDWFTQVYLHCIPHELRFGVIESEDRQRDPSLFGCLRTLTQHRFSGLQRSHSASRCWWRPTIPL
jgi:hypothetical protein